MAKAVTSMGEATGTPSSARIASWEPGRLVRAPVRESQGASPQVLAMLIDPQDQHGAQALSYGPVPFRIPRLASSDVNAWGSSASQHAPYTQGGYRGVSPGVGGSERAPRTRGVSLSMFVFHSRIPTLSDDRRSRAFAMRGSGNPNAARMNIPASFVPTAPITRQGG